MRRRKHLKKYASVRLIRAWQQIRLEKSVVLHVLVRMHACMYVGAALPPLMTKTYMPACMYTGAACHLQPRVTGVANSLHVCMLEPLCHPLQRVTGVANRLKRVTMLWGEMDDAVYQIW